MISASETNVANGLRRLRDRLNVIMSDGVDRGLLRSEEDTYVRDRMLTVEETEHGVTRGSWETEFIKKQSWFRATQTILWRLKGTGEYESASALLKNESSLSADEVSTLVQSFTSSLAHKFLETADESQREAHLESLLSQTFKDLRGEPVVHSSEVRLRGLVAPAQPVTLEIGGTEFLLRRPTEEDFAHEEYYYGLRERFKEDPSAVLHIKFSDTESYRTQKQIWKAVTILRLFKVGGVRYISHTNESVSLLNTMGTSTLTAGKTQTDYTRYIIEDVDAPKLKVFWERLNEVIPEEGYNHGTTEVSPVEIAYQRYSDALLTLGATVERRVADAVMGLESLLLRRSENDELSYRLRMRLAKVVSLLRKDPYDAKAMVNDAYSVRSAFVHGDTVSEKEKRRIEEKYGSLGALLRSSLEQLRTAIVVFSATQVGKDELISIVDDSFLDSKRMHELRRLIVPLRPII